MALCSRKKQFGKRRWVAYHVAYLLLLMTSNAMSDQHLDLKKLYHQVKNHKDLVDVIPDEIGISFPVPIAAGDAGIAMKFVFFHYYMKMKKPREFSISSPRYRTVAGSKGEIIETKAVTSKSFGVDWDDSKPIGEYVSDPSVPYEKKLEREDRFFLLYGRILPLFQSNSVQHEEQRNMIKEFRSLFIELGHQPLIPYYKSLNPEFFLWLEQY